MAGDFDPETLLELRRIKEVRIRPDRGADKAVTIWVVVAGEDVFVRSFQGVTGAWYRAIEADGRATLALGERELRVQATAAADPDSIERASREFLAKYRPSPYAERMVRPDILPTTLRLRPL